jgi:hypothetical protein
MADFKCLKGPPHCCVCVVHWLGSARLSASFPAIQVSISYSIHPLVELGFAEAGSINDL